MLRFIKRASLALCLITSAQFSVSEAANSNLLASAPFSQIDLSPDGKTVAAFNDGGQESRKVMLVDTATSKSNKFSIGDGKGGQAVISAINWVGNDYLAIGTNGDNDSVRLYVVKASDRSQQRRAKEGRSTFIKAIDGTSRFIVAEQISKDDSNSCRLLEYDAANNNAPKELYTCKSKTFECIVDSKGRVRLIKKDDSDGQNTAWYSINPDTGAEKKLNTIHQWTRIDGIVGSTSEAIIAGQINTTYPSIYVYDFEKDTITQVLVDHPTLSIETYAKSVFDPVSGQMIGLHLDLFERMTHWTDTSFAELQALVDKGLPGTRNRILDWSKGKKHVLVERFIATLPTQYLYLDVSTNSYNPIFINGPALKPQATGKTQLIKIPNRSGEELTAVLTIPPGKRNGKIPLLVWLGNGLWGDLQRAEWHPEANYFASDGFAVLRVNYTGTQGFLGNLHGDKSSKQGILAIFNDLEDSIKTLVDAGLVDPQKVCIGGEGTAGWVAAYAPIASPGQYKAVISINGLYDLAEYREASKGNNQMNGGMNLDFASANSKLSEAEVLSLSVPQNLNNYANAVFLTTGNWSTQEYKNHISSFAKALKKAKVSAKTYADDWWGPQLNGFKRVEAFKRAAPVLKSAIK